MSSILTIIEATGTQGASVVTSALKDRKYKIRAITRNTSSPKAQALVSQSIEVVSTDGSSAIFAMTNFFEALPTLGIEESMRIETAQGIDLANAAAKTPTLQHYIWSTLPSSFKRSNGKYSIPFFETKSKVDEYIKSKMDLYSKTTFLWVAYYGDNFQYPMILPNFLKTVGKHVQLALLTPLSKPLETFTQTSAVL